MCDPEYEETMMGNVFSAEGGGRCFCCYQAQKRHRRSSYNKTTEVKALTDLISVSECVNEGSVLCPLEDGPEEEEVVSQSCVLQFDRSPPEDSFEHTGGKSSESEVSESEIQSLFHNYRDGEDVILSEGVQRLCADLELAPEEFRVLILAWKCGAERMCRLTRSEFLEGLKALGCDSLSSLRSSLAETSTRLSMEFASSDSSSSTLSYSASFRDLYRFTYRFGLEPGQRILPTEMAISLWQLVFSTRTPSLDAVLPKWFHFLKIHSFIRGISKDTWNMFLNFLEIVGSDLASYDDTEAWPSLLDDFVEFENEEELSRTSKKQDS